jgi:hypothetical protein
MWNNIINPCGENNKRRKRERRKRRKKEREVKRPRTMDQKICDKNIMKEN